MNPEMITDTVSEWLETLDYEYMLLHTIICYGLYYSSNLRWIIERFSPVRKKGISKAVWTVGGVLAILEILRFIPYMETTEDVVQRIVSIVHSYVMIQVFVEPITTSVNNWLAIFFKSSGLDKLNGKKK